MEFLTRQKSKSYHVMVGENTACKMWNAGGMNKNKKTWELTQIKPDKTLCTMCSNNLSKVLIPC
jgi:hypothetical protein